MIGTSFCAAGHLDPVRRYEPFQSILRTFSEAIRSDTLNWLSN